MKFFILPMLFISTFFLSVSAMAQEDAGVLKAKLTILEAERDASLKKMSDIRAKHINDDRNLKRMHDKIMELHRTLAIALDSKPEIREMNDKIIRLDSEIESVSSKFKAAAAKPVQPLPVKDPKTVKDSKKGDK